MLYIIDFGLAKRYKDSKSGKHIDYKDGKSLTGTARYASINCHVGVEQSRRDDLESIGYVLLYFMRGNLPWQGLQGPEKNDKYRRIKECKIATSVELLIRGFPDQLAEYFTYWLLYTSDAADDLTRLHLDVCRIIQQKHQNTTLITT